LIVDVRRSWERWGMGMMIGFGRRVGRVGAVAVWRARQLGRLAVRIHIRHGRRLCGGCSSCCLCSRCRFQIPIPNRLRHGCEVTNKVNGVHTTILSGVSLYSSLSSLSGPSRSPLMNVPFERLTSLMKIYAQIVNNNIKKSVV
jgi:hypothetical protein